MSVTLYHETCNVLNEDSELKDQAGWCVWVTGLPESGKSMVAKAPLKPNVTVDSDKLTPAQCTQKILDTLRRAFYILRIYLSPVKSW